MGDFPLMTDKGTFVINGTGASSSSQLVRRASRRTGPDKVPT